MRVILFIISVFVFISIRTTAQQSPEVSQYLIHQPFVNTASITKSGAQNAALIFKQQWIGYQGAPTSLFMNFNMPLKSASRFGGIMPAHAGSSRYARLSKSTAEKQPGTVAS